MQEFTSLNNPDYDVRNNVAIFDDTNPEIARMEREALEYISISGADTKIYLRVNDLGGVDEVWEEDSQPLYEQPVLVKGQYVPDAMNLALSKWGYESNSSFDINYSRANLSSLFGPRLIRVGDVIEIYHNTLVQTQNTEFLDGNLGLANKFRVLRATDKGNFNYRWLYWSCTVELLTGNISVRPE